MVPLGKPVQSSSSFAKALVESYDPYNKKIVPAAPVALNKHRNNKKAVSPHHLLYGEKLFQIEFEHRRIENPLHFGSLNGGSSMALKQKSSQILCGIQSLLLKKDLLHWALTRSSRLSSTLLSLTGVQNFTVDILQSCYSVSNTKSPGLSNGVTRLKKIF